MQVKHAYVSGLSLWNGRAPGKRFCGRIRFERIGDGINYKWHLEDEDGKFVGYRSRGVSVRVIPPGQDHFEYALAHAIEGIRRYRMGRQKVFTVERWDWEKEDDN